MDSLNFVCGSIASPPICISQMWCSQCYSCVTWSYRWLRKRKWQQPGKSRNSSATTVTHSWCLPLTQNQVGMGTGARLPGQPSERSCSLDLVFNLIQSGLGYVGFGMVKKSPVLYDFFTRICFTAQRQSEKEFLSLLLANESSKGCVWQQKRFL